MQNKNIGVEEAEKKIKSYCSYQERNHKEVKNKLYEFGLYPHQVEELLSTIISEGYLNEERYAKAYAGGKFRIKHWGKIKISYNLKLKGVSSYCIKKGLNEIDEDEYLSLAKKLLTEKYKSLGKKSATKDVKVKNFLMQRGFEPSIIYSLLKEID
ncbi:MAG: regulatory protein RecX [Ferruginibacter sp.]